ncbi:MAG TPA: hypothetical protein VJ810_23655 [Blastocatellia bacterium]|nr:hypothetical protein [Blastocatellia bacterium]
MILNTQIWQQTVSAAKVAASNNPQWLRAIERADLEIRRSRYWAFDGSTLTIQSTTSKKLYRVDGNHTCDAIANGHKACRHRAARQLMIRYTERLNAAPLPAKADAKIERATLITEITATWARKYPRESLADNLMARFRCNNLSMLNTDFLRRVQVVLAQ